MEVHIDVNPQVGLYGTGLDGHVALRPVIRDARPGVLRLHAPPVQVGAGTQFVQRALIA